MLSLILILAGAILLPFQILGGLFRTGRALAFLVVFGVFSIFSGIATILVWSLKGLLPWILIAVGITMIVRANRAHPEVRKEAFESFYARRRT
ncbi:MAG: hypothetical protein IKS31_02500 [Clostridia bacterium]|nr:hypothetical protein [Clostridia bacterium]MBR4457810.1 hypothetical protein [Clostridia bacterium]